MTGGIIELEGVYIDISEKFKGGRIFHKSELIAGK
jgi:hypothetical protein